MENEQFVYLLTSILVRLALSILAIVTVDLVLSWRLMLSKSTSAPSKKFLNSLVSYNPDIDSTDTSVFE